MTQTDAILAAWLAAAVGEGGPYDPASLFLGVGTAVTDNGASTVLADITQATGDMATRQAVDAWSDPYKMADGRWVVDGPLLAFAPGDETEGQNLAVWFLASAAENGTLKAFGKISPAVPLPDENRHWSIVPRITIDPEGRFSAEVTFNGE